MKQKSLFPLLPYSLHHSKSKELKHKIEDPENSKEKKKR
jgi:hypothetical protein